MDILTHLSPNISRKPSADYSGEFGLPNALREHLLQEGMGNTALTLDAMLYSGLQPFHAYTLEQIMDALFKHGINTRKSLIYDGLQADFIAQNRLIKGRGRPVILYKIPMVESLVDHFKLQKWLVSDNLRAADLDNLPLYRRALHREFIARAPGDYPRAFLANRLGVCKRTTWNYDKAVGIQSEARFKRQTLYYLANGWERGLERAERGKQWLEAMFWQTGEVRKLPAITHAANWARNNGAELTLVTQLPNHYWIEGDLLNNTASRLPY